VIYDLALVFSLGMYWIVNFAIWPEQEPEPDSVTVASLQCKLTMIYASFTINVVYCVVRRNEYRSKGGDVLRLGNKGRYGVVCR